MRKLILATLVVSVAALSACDSKKNTDKETEEAVTRVLNNNPQIIINALKKMGGNAGAAAGQMSPDQVKKAIAANKEELFNDENSPVVGNKHGKKVVVEFFDYNCGYCKKMLPNILQILEKDKDVKIIFKELPILGPTSITAALAAVTVHDTNPDKYFKFHQELMTSEGQKTDDVIKQVAAKAGINGDKLLKDMKDKKYSDMLAKNTALAQALGIRGTPSLIAGDQFIRGMVTADVLDAAFKQQGK